MSDPVNISVSGIKCDNADCDYIDPSVALDDYPQWVNKPCPECGENLLTEGDYQATLMLIETAKALNSFGEVLGIDCDDEDRVKVKVELDGSGNLMFGDPE